MNVLWRRSCLPYHIYRVITKEITAKASFNIKACSYNTLNTTTILPNLTPVNYSANAIRCKSKKSVDEDSDEEDLIVDDDSSLSKDSKVVKFNTTSLRTDAILKSALGIARNKIEKLFYESKIRVNGKKILKKSVPIRPDYEIDVIKSISPKNPDHLYVARIEIINITAKEESIAITARRFKNLLIENYQTDPYKSSTTDEGQ